MYNLNEFDNRAQLDDSLAGKVAELLEQAVQEKGSASIAVSGGSTPKGFFTKLSQCDLPWKNITVTLADERWVNVESDSSNTRLVHENLLQGKAKAATFFHIKQGETLNEQTLNTLNLAADKGLLPLDVLILGMGEDGHTASLFPCSDEIEQALAENSSSLLKVTPKTAPHDRITFSFACLQQSQHTILHICGEGKKVVLDKAIAGHDVFEMPIRAFLHHPSLQTNVYWAE